MYKGQHGRGVTGLGGYLPQRCRREQARNGFRLGKSSMMSQGDDSACVATSMERRIGTAAGGALSRSRVSVRGGTSGQTTTLRC